MNIYYLLESLLSINLLKDKDQCELIKVKFLKKGNCLIFLPVQYLPLPNMTAPTNTTKAAYGDVPLKPIGNLIDLAALGRGTVSSTNPLSFEQLQISNGVVVYETVVGVTSVSIH